jgi:hypothetical protein
MMNMSSAQKDDICNIILFCMLEHPDLLEKINARFNE